MDLLGEGVCRACAVRSDLARGGTGLVWGSLDHTFFRQAGVGLTALGDCIYGRLGQLGLEVLGCWVPVAGWGEESRSRLGLA